MTMTIMYLLGVLYGIGKVIFLILGILCFIKYLRRKD